MFERSAFGIQNRAIFAGVQYVIYVEGESSVGSSEDEVFWRRLFDLYRPDLRVSFQSRGSKNQLLSIHEKIKKNHLSSAFVAVDRDYDHLVGGLRRSPYILYTHGYSWENDIAEREVIVRIVQHFAWNVENIDDVCQSVIERFSNLIRELSRFFIIDVYGTSLGRSAIDRDGLGRYVDINRCQLNRKAILEAARGVVVHKKNIAAPVSLPRIPKNWNPAKSGVGKFVFFCLRCCICVQQEIGGTSVSKEEFKRAVFTALQYANETNFSRSFRAHYSKRLSAI